MAICSSSSSRSPTRVTDRSDYGFEPDVSNSVIFSEELGLCQ